MSGIGRKHFLLPDGIVFEPVRNSPAWIVRNKARDRYQLIFLPTNLQVLLYPVNSKPHSRNGQWKCSIDQQPHQNLKKETSTKKRRLRSLSALAHAVVSNAIMDSVNPSSKSIRIGGVGYYAELEKKPTCEDSGASPEYILSLKLGYTHKVKLQVPKTLDIKIDKDSTTITISGIQRCFLGNFAAKVRAISPIEPYHKKGLCYVNEVVRSKVAKSRKNKAKE